MLHNKFFFYRATDRIICFIFYFKSKTNTVFIIESEQIEFIVFGWRYIFKNKLIIKIL